MSGSAPDEEDKSVAAKLTLRAKKPDVMRTVLIVIALIAGFGASHAVDLAGNAQGSASNAERAAMSAKQAAQEASALVSGLKAVQKRLIADEHANCQVLKSGRPAGLALLTAMSDIHALLRMPLSRAQRRQERHESPAVRRVVASLNTSLATYTRVENNRPPTKGC